MKVHYIQTINKISKSEEQAWKVIRTGDQVHKWHPLIESTKVIGNKRTSKTEQGFLEETILVSDDKTKTFKYSVDKQEFYPAKNIVGTMKVVEGKKSTLLFWDIEFELKQNHSLQEVVDGFEFLSDSVSRNL